jgi:hypothetical protein
MSQAVAIVAIKMAKIKKSHPDFMSLDGFCLVHNPVKRVTTIF